MMDKHRIRKIGGIEIWESVQEPYSEEVESSFANQLCLEEGTAQYEIGKSVVCKLKSGGWVIFLCPDEQGFSLTHFWVPEDEKATMSQIVKLVNTLEEEYCKPYFEEKCREEYEWCEYECERQEIALEKGWISKEEYEDCFKACQDELERCLENI